MAENQEVDFKLVASHLRKPDGEMGKVVAGYMNEGNKIITELTYKSVAKLSGGTILEIGFGNGFFMPRLIEKGFKRICGIDYSKIMVDEAGKLLEKYVTGNTMELKHASADSIPYPDDYFDKVCAINTIYFWDEPEKVVNEIKRVLKNDGLVSIGFRSKERIKDLEFAKYNFNLYSINEVEKLFIDNGFELVETVSEEEKIYDAVCVTVKKG